MSRHHRPTGINPVARAVAQQQAARARQQLNSVALSERISTLTLADGEPAAKHLATMAWAIAVSCEAALGVLGPQHATTRTLHGALRTIERVCLHHRYLWQAEYALALERAFELAHQVMVEHPTAAQRHISAGDAIGAVILARQLQPGMVAGIELYQPLTPGEPIGESHA